MNLLACDIGNTSVELGLYKGKRLKRSLRLPTKSFHKGFGRRFRAAFGRVPVDSAAIASVVPHAAVRLERLLRRALKKPVRLIGRDLKPPIRNRYRDPRQVGMDRLMNAVAFHRKYHRFGVVVDFGTAVTFDVVAQNGEYLGGVIAPGIEISIEALYRKTALLPRINLVGATRRVAPTPIIGRNTTEAIRAGCSYGIGGLCERIIAEIGKAYRRKPFVVATGGYARYMAGYCRGIDRLEPNLVLEVIRLTAS